MTNKKSLLLIFGLIMTTQMIFSQVPSYVPTNGLVGYWPFNGNANDVSGNGFNGTVNGALLTTDRFGSSNSAYNFNGINNYISCLPIPISGSSPRSVNFWYKETGTVTTGNTAFSWGAPTQSNRFDCGVSSGVSVGAAFSAKFFSYISTPTNWNMYTIILPSMTNPTVNDIIVYQNGVLLTNVITSNSISVSTPINTTANQPLNFGKNNNFTDQAHLLGNLDDIGIWNRALSQQEITNMYNGINYSDTCNSVSGSLTNGLVGYWPFCGNANDDSGNGNNGTVNGATLSTDRFGNSNSAYDFDGNSFISVSSTTELCLQNQFTISLWARRNNSTFMGLISKGRVNGGEGVSYHISGLESGAAVGINNDNGGCSSCNIATTPYLSNNFSSWNHYVGIWDGIRLKLYENGIMVSDVNGVLGDGNALLNTNFPLLFGRWSLSNYLNGQLDDIGIWNRALTQQEITQLFNQNQCINNITVTDTLIINVGQLSYTNPVAYANNITIYPNPANTQVNISFNNITDLTGGNINIINSLGQQVATTPITLSGTNTTMPLNTWGGTGLYFVQILNAQGIVVDVKKIILQ